MESPEKTFSLFNPFIAPRWGCGFGWTVAGHLQTADSEIQEFGQTVIRIESEVEGEQSVFIARSVSVCDALLAILETYVELFQEKDIGVQSCRNRCEWVTPVDEHLYAQLLQRLPEESQFPVNGCVVLLPSS